MKNVNLRLKLIEDCCLSYKHARGPFAIPALGIPQVPPLHNDDKLKYYNHFNILKKILARKSCKLDFFEKIEKIFWQKFGEAWKRSNHKTDPILIQLTFNPLCKIKTMII